MANVGTGDSGKTLIGTGSGSSPTYASIGTNSGLTSNGVVIAHGSSAFTASSAGANGQVLIGSTGSNPNFAYISSVDGSVTFTYGPNALDLSAGGAINSWVDVTTATQTMAVRTGYVTDRGGGVTYTLPATATFGQTIAIAGKLGAWTISQNANQQILVGSSSSTVGVGGSVASTNVGDCIELLCITGGASTVWRARSSMGNLTVV